MRHVLLSITLVLLSATMLNAAAQTFDVSKIDVRRTPSNNFVIYIYGHSLAPGPHRKIRISVPERISSQTIEGAWVSHAHMLGRPMVICMDLGVDQHYTKPAGSRSYSVTIGGATYTGQW
jgi:hypothetical protein